MERKRMLNLIPESFDPELWTIDAVVATDFPVLHTDENGNYFEVLSFEEGAVRLERLNSSGVLLFDHTREQVGRVVPDSVKVDKNQLLATFQLIKQSIHAQRIAAGELPAVSIGYFVHSTEWRRNEKGERILVVTDWEPYEVSAVLIPADFNAGFRKLGGNMSQQTEQPIDIVAERRRAVEEDLQRQKEVREIGRLAGMDSEQIEQMVADLECTKSHAQERAFSFMLNRAKGAEIHANFAIQAKEGKTWAEETRGIIRGLFKNEGKSGESLIKQIHGFARNQGVRTEGVSDRKLVKRAMQRSLGPLTTSDFPSIFAGEATDVLREAMGVNPQFNWWRDLGTRVDFDRTYAQNVVDVGNFAELPEVAEGAEYTAASVSDSKETITPRKYGKILTITDEMIINDQLNAIPRMLLAFADSTVRTESTIARRALEFGKMSDNKAVFHNDHGNLKTASAIDVAAINDLDLLLRKQKKDGVECGLAGSVILCGAKAYQIVSQIYSPQLMFTEVNDVPSARIQSIRDVPGLDENTIILCSGSPLGLQYGWLQSDGGPVVAESPEIANDSYSFRIRDFFACAVTDYRHFAKNPGLSM